MRLLVDTNVFIASLTDESDRGETATELLNADHEFTTTVLNLMELRSVLKEKTSRTVDCGGRDRRHLDIRRRVHARTE